MIKFSLRGPRVSSLNHQYEVRQSAGRPTLKPKAPQDPKFSHGLGFRVKLANPAMPINLTDHPPLNRKLANPTDFVTWINP